MDLRTQVKVWYRPDGPTYAMLGDTAVTNGCARAFPTDPFAPRSIHTVNNTCVVTPAFNSFVSCIWSHEAQHLSAATTSAQSSTNDVYKLWEPLAAKTSNDLQAAVSSQYSGAHTRVRTDAENAESTMTEHDYTFWDAVPGWASREKTTEC